jgi:hypothetical protein
VEGFREEGKLAFFEFDDSRRGGESSGDGFQEKLKAS